MAQNYVVVPVLHECVRTNFTTGLTALLLMTAAVHLTDRSTAAWRAAALWSVGRSVATHLQPHHTFRAQPAPKSGSLTSHQRRKQQGSPSLSPLLMRKARRRRGLPLLAGQKTRLFCDAIFIATKNDHHLTKTGSGQT
jgi:hypothetical protein